MHVYYASCVLALNFVSFSFYLLTYLSILIPSFFGLQGRQRAQRAARPDTAQALEMLELILKMLGDRAKNSILSTLLSYIASL